MKKYWKAFALTVASGLAPMALPPIISSSLSAMLIVFAVLEVVIVRWGNVTIRQIAARETWMKAGVIGAVGCFGWAIFLMPRLSSASFYGGLLSWLFVDVSTLTLLAGAGVAMMRNE